MKQFSFNFIEIFVFLLFQLTKSQLILKPSETIIFHSNFHPFIASCLSQTDLQQISWRSPSNVEISTNPNGRVTVEEKPNGLRLRIRNVTDDDRGIWKCLATDVQNQRFSNQFELRVKNPIKFLGDSIQYITLNNPALIHCRVTESHSTEISWFKGQEKIPIFADRFFSSRYEQNADGLRIERVSSIDEDLFTCQADQIETGETKEFQIQTVLAQEIHSVRIDCLSPCGVENRATTLICQADGMPKANYSWFYGQNLPLKPSSKFVIRENRLIINHVDETDNGKYSCLAQNNYDRIGRKTEFSLRTIIPPQLNSIPPVEIYLDENLSDQQVSFVCRLERGSTEELSFQWFRTNENQPLKISNEIFIDSKHWSSELRIRPVRRDHFGNYSCVAKNVAETTSTVAQLIVRYSPIFLGPHLDEILAVPKLLVEFQCQFDGSPPSLIEWRKISRDRNRSTIEILSNAKFRQITSTITESQLILNPTDNDFQYDFQCQTISSIRAQHSIKLRRAEPPKDVRIVKVFPHIDSIEIYLDIPTNSNQLPLRHLVVQYEDIDTAESLQTETYPVLSNRSDFILLRSLQAATTYRIRVAVQSDAGQSSFSPSVQSKTDPGKVPSFNLTESNSICDDSTSCLIRWRIYSDGGSAISHADLSFAKTERKFKSMKFSNPIEIDAELFEHRIENLQTDTNYTVVVRLSNRAGSETKWIQILTQLNCSNQKSSPKCRAAGPKKYVFILIVVLIVIILTVVIVLFIFLGHSNRKCCQQQHTSVSTVDPDTSTRESTNA